MELLIDVKKIAKTYEKKVIYKNADMKIYRGDSIALLGHNGSGKSTFLRLVSGLSSIDKGEIHYSKKLRFNYIPEHFPQMNITVRTYMKHVGSMGGLDNNTCEKRYLELLEKFYMKDMIDIPLKHLSKGTLQKVGVIQAVLIESDILLLDEPLSGQDLDSQRVFVDLISELNRNGITIIMSCHEKYLVNRISNKVYEINDHNFKKIEFDMKKNEMSVLIFEREEGVVEVSDMDSLIQKKEIRDGMIRILVKNSESNQLILKLVNKGYILRSMANE